MPDSQASLRVTELLMGGRQYVFKKGQVIQSSDGRMSLMLLKDGYVKRYLIAKDGTIGIQGLYGPNNFLPLTLAFELLFSPAQALYRGSETFYYETMTECTVYQMENQAFLDAVNKDPLLYRGLLLEAGKRLHFCIQRLENVTLKVAYKRLANQLVFYAREFGEKGANKDVEIPVPLTHQTLSEILNFTRETVSQSMATLRRKKLISTNDYIIITDINKLDELARS